MADITAAQITGLYETYLGRSPSQDEINNWINGTYGATDIAGITSQIQNSGEAQAYAQAHQTAVPRGTVPTPPAPGQPPWPTNPNPGGNWWEGPPPQGWSGQWPPPLPPGAKYGPIPGQIIAGPGGTSLPTPGGNNGGGGTFDWSKYPDPKAGFLAALQSGQFTDPEALVNAANANYNLPSGGGFAWYANKSVYATPG